MIVKPEGTHTDLEQEALGELYGFLERLRLTSDLLERCVEIFEDILEPRRSGAKSTLFG